MEISLAKPPIFEEASRLFGVKESDPIFYTFGNTIYAPCKKMPPDDLIRHEEMHAEQQGHSEEGAEEWWAHYFVDPEFRIEQEAEAYGEQYRFLEGRYHDRNKRAKILYELAAFLSGPTYGSAIGHREAMQKIKDYADGNALQGIEDHMGNQEELPL